MQELLGTGGHKTASVGSIGDVWDAYVDARAKMSRYSEQLKKDPSVEIDAKLRVLKQRFVDIRNDLAKHYLPLVRSTAERLRHRLPKTVELEDLMGEGVFGLMEAIDHFDVDRKIRFETFAPRRISGAMLDYLRSLDWTPRLVRSRAKLLNQAVHSHEIQFGRPPSQRELADRLGTSKQNTARIIRDGDPVVVASLDREIRMSNSLDNISLAEIIEDRSSPNPLSAAQRNDLKQMISRSLSRCERLIVILYYYEGMTMKEVGITLDLSESRVSQIHTSIVERLQAKFQGQEAELALQAV